MPRLPPRVAALLLPLLLIASAHGEGPASLRSAVAANPVPRDGSTTLLLEIKVAPPYHIQSAQPHDSSLIATKLALASAPGIIAGTPRFPIADELPVPAGVPGPPTLAIYQKTVYLQLPLTIAADAPLGEQTLSLAVTTQSCDDKSCLPPSTTTLKIPLTIAAQDAPAGPPTDAALAAAAAKQPYADAHPLPPAPVPPVAVAPAAGAQSDADQLSLIADRPYAPGNSQDQQHSIPGLILFGFLGGMILNIMPCVLPVIPLKVLALVQQAHGDRRRALLHALSFSAGIITLFIALALLLKSFSLFYGQQFQSPAFLIVMALAVVALALSMLGVWTINPPKALYALDAATQSSGLSAEHSTVSTSFTNGLLATLLATPCSAPYLGPLLAWALLQPAWITALALAWVGVGMSAPYLVLAAFPKLLSRVPRAGRWSELLKQALGIVMIGVAIYLITLLPNTALWPWALLGALLVGLVCWGWGQIPSFNMAPARIWSIRSAALVIGAALGLGLYAVAARATSQNSTNTWQPFSIAALDQGLADGRPVVVDWTASWCFNCHALEALVLSSDDVQKQFAASHALLLKADLSSDNPPASALNAKLGGQSIPTLAIFNPQHPTTPTVLRDSYSKAQLLHELSATTP